MKLSKDKINCEFVERIEELSAQNVYACYQCGKCSAGCPIVDHMDILPHTIIRLLQLGSEEEILNSKTIWLCSSCMQCAVKCPKSIDVTRVMDTLREFAKRNGANKADLEKISQKLWKKLPQQALVMRFRKCSE